MPALRCDQASIARPFRGAVGSPPPVGLDVSARFLATAREAGVSRDRCRPDRDNEPGQGHRGRAGQVARSSARRGAICAEKGFQLGDCVSECIVGANPRPPVSAGSLGPPGCDPRSHVERLEKGARLRVSGRDNPTRETSELDGIHEVSCNGPDRLRSDCTPAPEHPREDGQRSPAESQRTGPGARAYHQRGAAVAAPHRWTSEGRRVSLTAPLAAGAGLPSQQPRGRPPDRSEVPIVPSGFGADKQTPKGTAFPSTDAPATTIARARRSAAGSVAGGLAVVGPVSRYRPGDCSPGQLDCECRPLQARFRIDVRIDSHNGTCPPSDGPAPYLCTKSAIDGELIGAEAR